MTELTTYHATDRRVYNGAFCSDMQREADHVRMLEARLKAADSTASVTYFPVEGKYLAFHYPKPGRGPREVSGIFRVNRQLALIEAIEILEAR
jgi:hypothetical protein